MEKLTGPIYLELAFDEDEDLKPALERILKSPDFSGIIKTEVYPRLEYAIEQNKKEFALFRLVYYGVDLVLEKKYYKDLLKKVLSLYEAEEDYLKCIEIKKLIDIL